ncbi:MAG: Gfo/Idh/MocA family oxidoreductase [Rhodobacter sp.]|nr:Gfo/Idh/MocA family oxidoreductase [Rhodobacter sp.]
MAAPLRVVLVGLGYFSRFHLAAWKSLPGADLVGLTDLDADLTDRLAADTGVSAYRSLESMLDETAPDIVDLVVPPPAHAPLIRQALKRGRTLICQKPFCRSLAEAETITAEAEAAGTPLVIHENFRFQPWHREIRRFLDAGRMGRVFGARFALRPGDGRGPDAYLSRQPAFQNMDRFLVQETAVHQIDVFRWLFGPVEAIYADLQQLNPAIAGEDAGQVILTHANGVRSVFDGNRLADHIAGNPRTTMGEMAIEGEAGELRLDGDGRLWFRAFGAQAAEQVPITVPVDYSQFGGGCVQALCAHVVAALNGAGALENTARDYLDIVRLVEAAYRSNAEGRRIALAE